MLAVCIMLPCINSYYKSNGNDLQGRIVITAVTPEGQNYEADIVRVIFIILSYRLFLSNLSYYRGPEIHGTFLRVFLTPFKQQMRVPRVQSSYLYEFHELDSLPVSVFTVNVRYLTVEILVKTTHSFSRIGWRTSQRT